MQSTGVTSAEDADCTGLDWEDTYHGNFGEDDDNTQEQEAARWAGKNQVVSGTVHHRLNNALTLFLMIGPCQAHSSPTSIEGRTNPLETKRS